MTSHRLLGLAVLLALLLVPSAPSATSESGSPYTLSVRALRGATATDLDLTVSADGVELPQSLRKIQLKTFSAGGEQLRTENVFNVPLVDGRAVLTCNEPERNQLLEVKALLEIGSVHVLDASTRVALRPDLTVAQLNAPDRVVRTQPFDVSASIAEIAGDTAADATVSVYDGMTRLASQPLRVLAGGNALAKFSDLRIAEPGQHTLSVAVSGADPAEAHTANNIDQTPLTVRVYDGDGVVVTEESHATDVGAEVLRAGGNAIDAAAAIQFALNVTLPHTTGIGGGSTILVHLAKGETFAIDAREKAPAAATPNMFVGKALGNANRSGCAVGVPGTLRAVQLMLDRWGTMSLGDTLAPATALAEDGFHVGAALASATTEERARTQPETRAVFRRPDGLPLQEGDFLRQPDLARTFRLLAQDGPAALYSGEIAPALIAAQTRTVAQACQGRMTLDDLASYDIVVRKPLFTSYRGYDVVSVPPSSSGGLVVLQALKLLRRFPLGTAPFGADSCGATHLQIEALRLALADRAFWMGDDDPVFGFDVPVTGLLSDDYTRLRSELIHEDSRIPVAVPGNPEPFRDGGGPVEFDQPEALHTTHFSIVDKWGNMVSFTTTLTDGFGTGIMVPGYGFVLNDSLINFNLTPARNPGTGNPGANDAAPNRRAMGNTAPILLFKGGEPLVATGSPGGIFIPSVVLQVVTNLVDHGRSIQDAVAAPRIWLASPQGAIAWNAGFPPETIACLRALGHPLNRDPAASPRAVGSAESLAVDPTTYMLSAANDPRAPDGKAVVLP
jgi:gamma-glutamyltranspeptidase / glutathione hydrolase